jgi:restriction endonuclease S subunit
MKLTIDKSEWKKVRLGDVATAPSIRINKPCESGFDRFIGNANIGQWDFRLTTWEPTESVTSAMKGFEVGDYLFVRRSLYASDFRERSPRATFAGICSGDIITIRENPKKIADGFLIGVLNSSEIWKYVVANASGSITRRIKWCDLANYEFLLPPKDQQAKLAELLWAADAQWLSHQRSIASLDCALRSFVHDRILNHPRATEMRLEDVTLSMDGGKSPVCENENYVPGTPGILKTSAVTSGKFVSSEAKTVKAEDLGSLSISVKADSILINRKNTRELVGISCYVSESYPNLFLSDLIWQIRTNEKAIPRYLFYILSSPRIRNIFSSLSNGTSTTMVNIAKGNVAKVRVSLPPKKAQLSILEEIEKLEQSAELLKVTARNSKNLLKSLINQIF